MADLNNVVGQMALAVKKKHTDISTATTALQGAYQSAATDFQNQEVQAESDYQNFYTTDNNGKISVETGKFADAIAAIEAQKRAILDDDGDDTLVDTMAEMAEDIKNSFDDYLTQDTTNEGLLSGFRNDIESRWGAISDYTVDDSQALAFAAESVA